METLLCYEVGESKIHGRGVFATRNISKGDLIDTFRGFPCDDEDDIHVLWLEDGKGGWKGLFVTNDIRYANHSKNGNAELDGVYLYATKDIFTGEEITFHYGEDWNDYE